MLIFLFLINVFSQTLGYLSVISKPIKTYYNLVETKIDNYEIPLNIVQGMELKFGEDSNGEILLTNGAVLRVAPRSQISLEKLSGNKLLISVMYGAIHYNGSASIEINSRAMHAYSSGGTIAFKYDRNKLNGVFFNFNSKITVKHSWNSKTYKLDPNKAFVLYSFNGKKKLSNMNAKYKKNIEEMFDMQFSPGGKIFFSRDILSIDLSKYSLPSMKGNIDYIRRVVNIF